MSRYLVIKTKEDKVLKAEHLTNELKFAVNALEAEVIRVSDMKKLSLYGDRWIDLDEYEHEPFNFPRENGNNWRLQTGSELNRGSAKE